MKKGVVMLLVAVFLLLVVVVVSALQTRLTLIWKPEQSGSASVATPTTIAAEPAATRTAAISSAAVAGTLLTKKAYSQALAKDIDYAIYLPAGYNTGTSRYPVIYLLHGRGGSMGEWEPVLSLMDSMIQAGQIPPTIFIVPDAPSSKRASYFIDSEFAGNDALPPGEKVETAFTVDLIAHVDSTYRTMTNRNGRAVAGFSMGGYGALRYALAHPELFRAAIALSPAVYYPLPPASSSTREFGAFGRASAVFDDAVYTEKDYPAMFLSFEAANLPSALFIAVGDDEDINVDPADAVHDLDYEAHTLYNKARRVKNLLVELRVLDGGHDWQVWRPGLLEGLQYIYRFVKAE